MILKQAIENRIIGRKHFYNYSFSEKKIAGKRLIIVKNNNFNRSLQTSPQKRSNKNKKCQKVDVHSRHNTHSTILLHSKVNLTILQSNQQQKKQQTSENKLEQLIQFYQRIKEPINYSTDYDKIDSKQCDSNNTVLYCHTLKYNDEKKQGLTKKQSLTKKSSLAIDSYKAILKIKNKWKLDDMPELLLHGKQLQIWKQKSHQNQQKLTILHSKSTSYQTQKLEQRSQLFLLQISSSRYCKVHLNSRNAQSSLANLAKSKMDRLNLQSNQSMKQILRVFNNFDTNLHANIFYCNLKHLNFSNRQGQPKQKLCNFFMINCPVKHHEKSQVQEIIFQFLLKYLKQIAENSEQNSGNQLKLDQQTAQNIHKEFYIIDSRGCTSIFQLSSLLHWQKHQRTCLSPIKQIKFASNMLRKQNQCKVQNFIANVKKLINLQLKQSNSLFE